MATPFIVQGKQTHDETGQEYGNGNNEKMIGKAIKGFDRKKIFINTKILTETGEYKSKQDVLDRARKALERLDTDYIEHYASVQKQHGYLRMRPFMEQWISLVSPPRGRSGGSSDGCCR